MPRPRFSNWLKRFMDEEEIRQHAESLRKLHQEQRKKQGGKRVHPRYGARTDMNCRAVQAFWAMHVEAMNWSGMRLSDYAAALNLSPTSLRRWRNRLEDGEVEIDWRAHLHPSARPQISSDGSSAAKVSLPKLPLTDACEADGRANRRSFSDEEKRSIVLETEQPGVSVAEVCRRHGIVTSMVFRWRVQFGFTRRKKADLVTVMQSDGVPGEASLPVILQDLLQPPSGMMAVDLPDGRRVFVPEGSDPAAVCREVLEMEACR
ncbi:conserved hypothetical protein [Magnetospirillum molischianum DSM 120]|uniref:Transposase n=2 Tax=Magnetospirillum molischianum TaxID=1083 RepID=H8FWU2_MAGML|nr:conserved hypothetical protein [Magnetospirillum molischianum DSM 120]